MKWNGLGQVHREVLSWEGDEIGWVELSWEMRWDGMGWDECGTGRDGMGWDEEWDEQANSYLVDNILFNCLSLFNFGNKNLHKNFKIL